MKLVCIHSICLSSFTTEICIHIWYWLVSNHRNYSVTFLSIIMYLRFSHQRLNVDIVHSVFKYEKIYRILTPSQCTYELLPIFIVINNAKLNILYTSPWAPMHISLGNIFRNGIAGLWGMNILNFISVKLLSEMTKIIYTPLAKYQNS